MRMVLKKRRFYQGRYREVGETVDMNPKHARAFKNSGAAVPAVTQTKKSLELKRTAMKRERKPDLVENAQTASEQTMDEDVKSAPESGTTHENSDDSVGGDDEKPYFEGLSYHELRELCRQRGVDSSGKTSELIDRLKEAVQERVD